MELTYHGKGDYLIPDVSLDDGSSYNIGKYGDLYYFNQKNEKARQEQLEAILNVDKDELLEIAKEIDETLEKGGICIIGGKNQIDQCDLDEVISL